jgi:hypothetical protein
VAVVREYRISNINIICRAVFICALIHVYVSCSPMEDIIVGPDNSTPKNSINLRKTSVLATSGDNILRLEKGIFYMTNDLGKTWKSLENSIGIVSYVHWFKDNSCLICGRSKAYWVDTSFSQLHKSKVFDYDGSVLDDDSPHFYAPLRGRKDYQELGGRETWIWNDYFGEVNGYISRVWQTNDNGRTIHCICKIGETKTTDGRKIACRHFHDCALRESNGDLYITSGDSGGQCKLIKGRLIENSWQFDVLGEGNLFKFGTVLMDEQYLYFLCDYTGYGNTGILRVSFSDAGNIERYQYVFTCQDNRPLSKVYYINNYSFIIYDGSVNGRMLISYNSEQYKNLYVAFEKESSSIAALSNQNNAGLVLIQKAEGYYISDLKLNDYMYDFTEAMEEAGYRDFRSF